MLQIEKEIEVRMFDHKCQICGRLWQSKEKADYCLKCGHWNMTFSSFLVFKKARNIKQNRSVKCQMN